MLEIYFILVSARCFGLMLVLGERRVQVVNCVTVHIQVPVTMFTKYFPCTYRPLIQQAKPAPILVGWSFFGLV